MAIQSINIGSIANDGTGDDLREAFNKVNANFIDLDTKLSTAEGDITEDRALIEGLESAKQQSLDASARLSEGKEISTSINKTAERYRMVAKRGATIFFLMNSLHCIHT